MFFFRAKPVEVLILNFHQYLSFLCNDFLSLLLFIIILIFFFDFVSQTMIKLVQVYGHNYARQREKLAALLDDLAILQVPVV